MTLIYNPVSKKLGSTDNNNWYNDLKSNISSMFSTDNDSSFISEINNIFNGVNSTVDTIKQTIESSGLLENILSVSNNVTEISNSISNILNNNEISYEDKTILLKLQKAIADGTLVKQLPANANINDYQMIKINNTIFYIKKDKTKQYIIYGVIGLVIISIILMIAKKR